MNYRDSDLRGLPVVTEAGDKVGRLAGLMIDAGSHSVAHYVVAKSRLLAAILPKELLVHPSQVVSIDDEKMVVKADLVTEAVAAEVVGVRRDPATGGISGMSRSVKN